MGDKILTYGYVKPRDQGFPTERPPTYSSRIARWLYPSGVLARTLRPKKPPDPERNRAIAWGLGAPLSLRLPIDRSLDQILSLLLAIGAS